MTAVLTARRLSRRLVPPRVRQALRTARQVPAPKPAAAARPAPPAEPPPPPTRETLIRMLERGEALDRAIVTQVRSLVGAKEHDTAVAIAEALRARPETAPLGHLAAGIAAARRGYRELAWAELRGLPRVTWAMYAPAEYLRAGLIVAPDEALRELRALVAEDPAEVQAKSWHEILSVVWGLGEAELARAVFAIFERHVEADSPLWRNAELHRDWMRPWVAADPDSPSAPAPPGGRRTFAVLDYGHPSATKASANIGDHVQTIAALGHVVRHQGVRLHGDEDLVDLLAQLRSRTRSERQRSDIDADLEVITVHRDASIYEPIPEDTWAFCFGWFMHSLFRMRHAFPLHRNLRPIFVSFHCNKRELLTPDAIEYLKRYGPVGCRDWTTVDLLLSIGVPAFFSGCLTATIDTVFPDLAASPDADAPVAYVDMPAEDVPAGAPTFEHSSDAVRGRSFVANVYAALDLLETYRRDHRAVVTSRLHCYLPVRSLGMDVDFQPANRSNPRFDGLIDIADGAFDAMRNALLTNLEQVFDAILAGRAEDEVYGLWRELNAAGVAAAEERRNRAPRLAPVAVDGGVEAALSRSVAHGPPAPDGAVDCAIVLPQGGFLNASVLVASLLEHGSRPLRLWVLARPGTDAIEQRLAARFPELSFTWIPTDGHDRDLRLLLPDLLPDVARAIVLPMPAVATGDVAELADLDLGGHAVAAPLRPGTADASGFGVIDDAAARLEDRTQASAELRRTAHARHAFDFDAFDTDVLVLDLERLRRDGFTAQALALVQAFGLDDVEAMHYLCGPDRATLPERWAVVPTRTPVRGAGLLHWVDDVKPWQQTLTPERDEWRRYAAALKDRETPVQA
ncbi:MAG TPA: glycosyltransferase [Solirubrobacteraceae bacterium]|nr:glycosyltransferase [Solirubrobacteraceae bacterium]